MHPLARHLLMLPNVSFVLFRFAVFACIAVAVGCIFPNEQQLPSPHSPIPAGRSFVHRALSHIRDAHDHGSLTVALLTHCTATSEARHPVSAVLEHEKAKGKKAKTEKQPTEPTSTPSIESSETLTHRNKRCEWDGRPVTRGQGVDDENRSASAFVCTACECS